MSPSQSRTKKKRTTSLYTEEVFKKALAEIRDKKKSIRQICREYGIPKSTILDRISGRSTDELKKRGPDPVLGKEGEKKVVEWLVNISKCGFPIKKQEILDTVQKIIKDNGIKNKLKDGRPGHKWFENFLKRNKVISVKYAERIKKVKTQVTEASIRLWFKEFEKFLESIGQKDILNHPKRIFNVEVSKFPLCPKTGKVLAPKGYRNVYEIKPGSKEDTITVLLTFNAYGNISPPCVVFPYVRPPKAVVNSMPSKWCLGKTETGWMRDDVFFEYITNEFNSCIEENHVEKPVILLVDGRNVHMSLMFSNVCEDMQIILYALPPNVTHVLQPAEMSLFEPLKTHWKSTVGKFLGKEEDLNSAITKTNFCVILNETLKDHSMSEHIKTGFKHFGIYPFNLNSPDYTKCVGKTMKKLKDFKSSKHKIESAIQSTTKTEVDNISVEIEFESNENSLMELSNSVQNIENIGTGYIETIWMQPSKQQFLN